MKTLTITALGLALVAIGFVQVQSAGMEKTMDKTMMHNDKGMHADGMSMQHDEMQPTTEGMHDGMQDEGMKMISDVMMDSRKEDGMESHSDGMKEMDADGMMKHEDSMEMDQDDKSMDDMKDSSMDQTRIPSDAELRERLTPLQYKVTRKDGTEPPFNNAYWDNHEPGLYVDIISGVPLFSSTDKYESGTGWPSFTKPVDPDHIIEKEDRSWFSVRTEIRARLSDAHLGHVFNDGPEPTGLRYCMNSAALRFVPVADLEKEGYGEYLALFR